MCVCVRIIKQCIYPLYTVCVADIHHRKPHTIASVQLSYPRPKLIKCALKINLYNLYENVMRNK